MDGPLHGLVEEPECYDDVMTIGKDTGGDPMCEISSQPFTIADRDNSGSNEVRFLFENNWLARIDHINLYYDRGDGSGKQCQSLDSLSSGATYPRTLAAACNPRTQSAEIEVYVSNDNISFSSNWGQCGVSALGSCSYVFKIPCSAGVMCDGARRLDDSVFTEL